MKILHISSPLSWRGGEQQVQYMIDSQDINHDIYLYSPSDSVLTQKNQNITLFDFKDGVITSFSTAKYLATLNKEHNFDIIHAHDSKAHTILWMAYLLFGLDVKSVVHRRVDFNPKYTSRLKYNHPKISKIICVSEQVKSTLSNHINDLSKLELIHSGVDISIEKNNNLIKQIAPPIGTFTIAIIAALTSEKRHDIFLAVANILSESYPHLHFIIIGEGTLRNEIEIYIQQNNLEKRVTLTGQIHDAKSKLIDIDLILHTAEKEGLGTSLIEALSSGIPVIANRTGGIPEIISQGINGYLINKNKIEDYVSIIKRLINNPIQYSEMKGRSMASVQKFDKEIMNGKIIAIYNDILNNKLI